MKTFKVANRITIMLLSVAALFGVASAAGISLNGAGATFPFPLYSKWFDVYEKKTGAKINYQSIGSGGGIQQLKAKTVDFGASDAPLSNQEVTEMSAPVVHIPTVAGAEALIYNVSGIAQGLKLDATTVAGIYLGEIKSWNDPKIAALNSGAKLPNTPIAIAHRSDGSGTTFTFTDYLSNVSATWKTKVGTGKSVSWPVGIGGKGNEGVAGVVKQTPGGIGYVELAYAIQNKENYAALKNKAGNFVLPSTKGATAAAAGGVNAMKKDVRVSVVDSGGEGRISHHRLPLHSRVHAAVGPDEGQGADGLSQVGHSRRPAVCR